ncbi:MAG: Na(+)/H(+) antiporter subunit B [Sulfolobales archaeon]|nr:Na(+)/H(+) antiporter subunit B [Sulfolobales archaeon]MCX8209188.1 Na(+)/H(+) antiporter subunit B [Sulfolobales archaeon]MDW8010048.1 Na(+)/H(+) antiporter subunit B [Sulfolobales archaeon]
MNAREVAIATSITLMIVLLAYVIEAGGLGPIAPEKLRELAASYIISTYNPWNITHSAQSLEAVTAIVWDYRGLDTFFETSVLFISIVGVALLFRGYREKTGVGGRGLSEIVKTSTKILAPLILIAGISIAIHGHLTPGGGFQGGSFIAVLLVLLSVVFSLDFVVERGLSTSRLLTLRSIGLMGVFATSIALLLVGLVTGVSAYVFQNMVREGAPVSMPPWFLDRPTGGTLLFFNVFEALAVATGLSLAFIVLSLRREEVEEALERGEWYE